MDTLDVGLQVKNGYFAKFMIYVLQNLVVLALVL